LIPQKNININDISQPFFYHSYTTTHILLKAITLISNAMITQENEEITIFIYEIE